MNTIAVLVLALLVAPPVSTPDDKMVETLRSEYAQWQAEIEFAGTFELRRTSFPEKDLALHANWDWSRVSESDHGLIAFGYLAKKGEMFRIRYEPTSDRVTKLVIETAASVDLKNIGCEEVSDNRMTLKRPVLRARKAVDDALQIDKCIPGKDAVKMPRYTTLSTIGLITPVRPLGAFSGDPFQVTGPTEPEQLVKVAVKLTEDSSTGHYVVTLTGSRADWRSTRELRFRIASPHRLESSIERYYASLESGDDAWDSQTEVSLSGFVTLEGKEIPARIRQRLTDRGGLVRQSEFYSPDMGKSAQGDKDFVYPLDARLEITGLKNPDKWRAMGELDLRKLSLDDLVDTTHPDDR